jgi:CMP-N-acetylneuraminic acid synthetase
MRLIAIITARGGSKGLHRKNVLDLGGKPLIAWTIEAALKSKIFDKVVVTTDDKEIKDVSLRFGSEVVDRPSELATDTTSSLDVIEHTLSIYNQEKFTHFVLLQPTSPLRNFEHIQNAWRLYIEKNVNSLVSVVEVEHSPFKMLIEKDREIKPLTKWEDLTKPRQQLPVAYMPNGAIYISKIEKFLKTKNLFCSPLEIFKMDKTSSIDIDNRDDFDRIERIIDVN